MYMYSESDIVKSGKAYEKQAGVYFLIDGNEIVYVGQSADILFRISQHINAGRKQFDRYATINCGVYDPNDVEAEYIVNLVPRYNVMLPENRRWATVAMLKRLTNKDLPAIKRHIKANEITDTNGYYLIADFEELVG